MKLPTISRPRRVSWRLSARTAWTPLSWSWPSRRNSTSTSPTRRPRSSAPWGRRCSTCTRRWGNSAMRRRVAITGLGVVTPLRTSVSSTWEGLIAGRSGAGPITRFDPAQSPVRFACEVKGFDPAGFLERKEIRRFDLFSQFAIGAAEEAVSDGCLTNNWDKLDLTRVGVIVGTGTGGGAALEGNCPALIEKGARRAAPLFIPLY